MTAGHWLPVRRAAPLLGYTEQGLRERIATRPEEVRQREEVRGNRKRLLVWVDAPPERQPERNAAVELAELRTKVAELERVVAAKDAHLGELRIALDVERARVNRLIERPARRWWWWRGGGAE